MVKISYDWDSGVELLRHTAQKHAILREYFRAYLLTRCKIPQQEKFRLVVVDAFCGSGLYSKGEYGSPLIFVDVLSQCVEEINLERGIASLKPLKIECLLILNDDNEHAYQAVQTNLVPFLVKSRELGKKLDLKVEYENKDFQRYYPNFKQRVLATNCRNVFFNLDQCGYGQVSVAMIRDIISSWRSSEIILTFSIQSLLTFLSPTKANQIGSIDPALSEKINALNTGSRGSMSKREWLGVAEKVVFNYLKDCAAFVSPFAIHNPDGWQYWLMHFATSYRARQVYNNILHNQELTQVHFGRSGLSMLAYDPSTEGQFYLFDENSRERAIQDLHADIPRLVSESGEAISMMEFYDQAYSETAAHSDDIHESILLNPDLEVLTPNGSRRRSANQIKPHDTLVRVKQRSFPWS